tara:strand:+ start:1273 stop:1398 length:126 start_codon:yes stop_codon:yes gene_type:complete
MGYINKKWNHLRHWWGRLSKKGKIFFGAIAVIVIYLLITNA